MRLFKGPSGVLQRLLQASVGRGRADEIHDCGGHKAAALERRLCAVWDALSLRVGHQLKGQRFVLQSFSRHLVEARGCVCCMERACVWWYGDAAGDGR